MDARVPVASRSRGSAAALGAAVLALAVLTIVGAYAFQAAGFAPCELCLKERLPYLVGIALAGVTLVLAKRGSARLAQAGFAMLTLVFLFSAGFGIYHAGVEWGFWPGPSSCTGAVTRATSNADFMQQLQSAHVVRCDAVAIRILGLSLAGWNAVISLAIAGLALFGMRRALMP